MYEIWREMADRLALRYGTVPRDLWRVLAAPAVLEMMDELKGAGQREEAVMLAAIALLEGEDDIPIDDMRTEAVSMAMTAIDAMQTAMVWVTGKHFAAVETALHVAYDRVKSVLKGGEEKC